MIKEAHPSARVPDLSFQVHLLGPSVQHHEVPVVTTVLFYYHLVCFLSAGQSQPSPCSLERLLLILEDLTQVSSLLGRLLSLLLHPPRKP